LPPSMTTPLVAGRSESRLSKVVPHKERDCCRFSVLELVRKTPGLNVGLNVGQAKRAVVQPWRSRYEWWRKSARRSSVFRAAQRGPACSISARRWWSWRVWCEDVAVRGTELAVGEPVRRYAGLVIFSSLALASLFAAVTVVSKVMPALNLREPWQDDPYDGLVSLDFVLLPLLVALGGVARPTVSPV
jgi:hypothetical protein